MTRRTTSGGRRSELAARLAEVHDRIAAACADAGRDPDGVRLVVVTKFFPAGDVELLAEPRRHRRRGEPRPGGVGEGAPRCPDRDRCTVHFIGQVQSSKAGSVARYADMVQSVDRAKLVAALDRGAQQAGRRLRGRWCRSTSTTEAAAGRGAAGGGARSWPTRWRPPRTWTCAA